MTEFTIALAVVAVLAVGGNLYAVWAWRRKRESELAIISAKDTLEALIPAIMDIEQGYHEHVIGFLSDANKGLERLGSPYRFSSTFKLKRAWDKSGNFVDSISVIDIETGDE